MQMLKPIKKEKGVAGLQILLSVVTMLFVIGILIMAYTIAGAEIQDAIKESTNDTTAIGVVNDTANALADVIDWFPTFIVITAVVVLILLIVMIIVAVRGTGLMGGA